MTRLLAVAAAVVLACSTVKDVPHTWSVMDGQHARFAGYTRLQREQAYGTELPLPMDIFEWYRHYLLAGDRYFVQIQNGAFGRFIDKETAVRTVARLYLLPAIEARDLDHANVVLSFDSDPSRLHLHYTEQERAGAQLIFFSRIDRGA